MTNPNLLCLFLVVMGADAENRTLPGRFVVEHPTLLNLGFEWEIRGDANRNATVAVQFRAWVNLVGERRCRWFAWAASTCTGSERISTTRFPLDLPAAS